MSAGGNSAVSRGGAFGEDGHRPCARRAGSGDFGAVHRSRPRRDEDAQDHSMEPLPSAYDTWIDAFAKDGREERRRCDHRSHPPSGDAARAAAEVSAQAGHDLFGFTGSGGPRLYIKHLLDLSPLVAEMKKYGKVQPIGRQIAYDPDSNTWPAYPDWY